jgi:erythromycin esterase
MTRVILLMHRSIGHRAIGLVYNPRYELGNYVTSVIPKHYDAFLYIDETHALKPLHMKPKKDLVGEFHS